MEINLDFNSCAFDSKFTASNPTNYTMSIITENIKVTGMTCGHCQKFVSNVINAIPGVTGSEVSLQDHVATITYDSDKTSRDQIVKAVNETQTYHAE